MKKIFISLTMIAIIISSLFMFVGCKNTVLRENTDFFISEVFVNSSAINLGDTNLKMALSPNSRITLGRNGDATIELYIDNAFIGIINKLISDGLLDDVNVGEYLSVITAFLPGFEFGDMNSTLQIVKDNLGLSIVGLDFEEDAINEVFEDIDKSGKIPSSFKIKRGFGIIFSSKYYIKTIESQDSSEKLIAVYFADYKDNIEPYIIMQLVLDGKGKPKTLLYPNDMVSLSLKACLTKIQSKNPCH